MRFIGIALVLLSIPVFIALLKGRPDRLKYAAYAIGFLPLTIGFIDINASLLDYRMWPGHSKGLIITLLDSMALAIILAYGFRPGSKPIFTLLCLYILAALVSVFFANAVLTSSFYVFQLVRISLIFLAVVVLLQQEAGRQWLTLGLASGAILQFGFTLSQKLGGAVQASGTAGHQNLLGVMLHFATIPLLAMVLGGDRRKIILFGAFAGLAAAAFTASRATIGFVGIGAIVLLILSLLRGDASTKLRAVGFGVLGAALVVPLALTSLSGRFDINEKTGDDEREKYDMAAHAMWDDNPMGVGANFFVVEANSGEYYSRAGISAFGVNRSGTVHDMYLLIAAETGWLGVATFIALLATAISGGIVYAFRHRDSPDGMFVLGCAVALLTMALHAMYEWIIVYYNVQCLMAIALGGVAAGLSRKGAAVTAKVHAPTARYHAVVGEVMR